MEAAKAPRLSRLSRIDSRNEIIIIVNKLNTTCCHSRHYYGAILRKLSIVITIFHQQVPSQYYDKFPLSTHIHILLAIR